MTTEFMLGVQDGTYWLPKTEEIRLLNCADPPKKQTIADILVDKMVNIPAQGEPFDTMIQRTAFKVKKNPPNKDWMLGMLSTIHNANELFEKGYVKPRVDARGIEMLDKSLVDNHDDFFTGLPVAKPNKKRTGVKFVNKEALK
jgi:hypothetical protein